jgi:hypothetical protein
VGRQSVDEIRAVLVQAEAGQVGNDGIAPAVEVDLREVTEFSRLGVAVLVAARRWFGDRLRILGNDAVVGLIADAGLTRVLQLGA